MGSVKDLQVLQEPEVNSSGIGRFTFSDRYSVFDWGEMPDLIRSKGESLCLIGAYFFEKLQTMGIPTHYRGLVENGQLKTLDQLSSPSNIMEVDLFRVIHPEFTDGKYDYRIYSELKGNYLIPLEVIFRNSLPAGSSVFRRLKKGEIDYKYLGLESMPVPGQKLKNPILDVSTKLENTDRYLNWKEALEISGLNRQQISELKELTLQINNLITDKVSTIGLENEDGKFEFGISATGQLTVVDVLGTPDECRFTAENGKIPVSKEIARIYYRRTPWYAEIEEAKKTKGINWKENCTPPEPLPTDLRLLIEQIYQSICNSITGREWYEVPDLPIVLETIKQYMEL